MRYSQTFIYTHKESESNFESVSHDLIFRAGLAHQVAAGHYDILPLGTKVLKKIENIVREEMNYAGAQEIIMPIMQPSSLWQESQRWDIYGEEMFKLKSRTQRDFCLGPTHEELIVDLARAHVQSYRDLPFTLYQFGTKFRDEKRPRSGLLRSKEFIMKDAYSFDIDKNGLNESYDIMRDAYLSILKRIGVMAIPTVAQTGEMGGNFSEEFMAPSPAGEDKFVVDDEGKATKLEDVTYNIDKNDIQTGIEICHIFMLGTRYSSSMGLTYMDQNGNNHPVLMGCYGVGVSRMLPTAIEQNHDDKGIIWPREIAPFDAVIIPIRYDKPIVRETTEQIYQDLLSNGFEILLDDRDINPGTKFYDHDLLGIPNKIIIGERGIKKNQIEFEHRADGAKEFIRLDNIVEDLSKRI